MAKKVSRKKTEGDETPNFQNLEVLKAEFKSKKMPDPKLKALKRKLVGHFNDGSITDDEQEFMEEILKKGNLLRTLTSSEKYLFNALEYDRCEGIAVVKSDDVPVVLHLRKDLACRFNYDEYFDDGKGKPDSLGRYHVYVPRTIAPRHQLDYAAAVKLAEKQPLAPGEEPASKVVIHHIILKEKEFKKWFEVQNPDILTSEQKEELETQAYNF